MIETILDHAVASPHERVYDREVRHVAGREEQRTRPECESREFLLEQMVLAAVSAHQVRGAAADTPLTRGSDKRIDHAWMIGQAQVVVAAESEQLAAIDVRAHATRLAGLDLAPRTQSSRCGKRRQAGLE